MNNSEDLKPKLESWLKKEGYPLEMKVASAIRKYTNFDVRQGWHYQDPETKSSREIDVVATASEVRGIAEINFVFECKGTKKPWVLFTSEDAAEGYHRLSAFGIFSKLSHSAISSAIFKDGHESKFEKAKNIPWFWKDERVGYSISQAFEGNKDTPYVGTLSSVKASMWLQKNSLWQSAEHRNHAISFPVVVTSSPLFECFIDKKGNHVLHPINHGFLFFSQHIEGFSHTCVSIVNESYIEDFVKECDVVASEMYKLLSTSLDEEWDDFIGDSGDKNT